MVVPAPVTVSFFLPSADLRPYVSSIYLTAIEPSSGETITDWLMPEWAALRMASEAVGRVAIGSQPEQPAPLMMVSGPTSLATRIEIGAAQIWGVGILPLGWARLVGAPAHQFADLIADGLREAALEHLAPLHPQIFTGDPDPALVAARIDHFLRDLLAARPPGEDEDRVRAAHRLLIDADVATVGEFAERLGLTARTLERFCLRVFGFPPKLLLRRQRFTRSLAQFLLDPSLAWIRTLDQGYVDQAHFVRDFRRFMGMSPSAYGSADHPILRATVAPRQAQVGGAVQVLHRP